MIESIKILGQAAPSANILTTLYTVPSSTTTTISSIVVCNRSNSTVTFRISNAINSAVDALAQYLYYDQELSENSTFIITIGITLSQNDILRVSSNSNSCSFNVYGIEVS